MMDVKFLRGLSTKFATITPDSKTFYFLTDKNELYLGSVLLSNEVTAEAFDALEKRVKALEDAGFQAQIDAINETLKSIATSDTVVAIDNRLKAVEADLKAVEADYLKGADKTDLEGKITAHETAVNTKFADYSTTEQMNAAIDADVKVVTDYIAANEAKWSEKTDISSLETRMTAVEGVADAAQTAQEVSNAIDAKITALDLANTYEAKGAAAQAIEDANLGQYTTEQEVKDIVDGVIASAADSETYNSLTKLVDYIDAHGGEASEMAQAIDTLEGKVDVEKVSTAIAAATTDMATNAGVATALEPYAKTADISADIAKGVEAQGWGNHATQGYAKSTDVASQDAVVLAEAQAYTDALSPRIEKGETAHGWGNHATQGYAKTDDLGALATKDVVSHTELDEELTEQYNLVNALKDIVSPSDGGAITSIFLDTSVTLDQSGLEVRSGTEGSTRYEGACIVIDQGPDIGVRKEIYLPNPSVFNEDETATLVAETASNSVVRNESGFTYIDGKIVLRNEGYDEVSFEQDAIYFKDYSVHPEEGESKYVQYSDIALKSEIEEAGYAVYSDIEASLEKADTALQAHQDISHLATKTVVGDGFGDKTITAVITENATTCQNNFNTIVTQLTWGEF